MRRAILLPFFGDLGDTILAVPAFRAVRERYPEARLIVLSKSLTSDILLDLKLVDSAIDADKHLFDRTSALLNPRAMVSVARLVRRLRREHPDTLILFHHLVTRWGALKFAAVALACGAPHRIGLDNGRGWFLTATIPDRGFGDRHEAQYWLDVAAHAGAPGEMRLEFPVSDRDREAARELMDGVTGASPIVAIHPGTGWYGPGRRWPAERFAQTAAMVSERTNAQVILVGTEEDREQTRQVADRLAGRVVDLTARTSVRQLGALLERCDVLVANDGGVAHLAAAVGTPVITIFGPSNDRAWRPIGGTVIAADLPCRPCFYRDFERGLPSGCRTRECLSLVTPARVARAIYACLEERARAG